MIRSEVREGVVAGSRVRCRSSLAACLDELDHLCLGRDGAAAGLVIAYELEPTPDGRYALVRDGLTFAVTDHAENLVTLLQKDVRSALERRAAERGMWLHAAGLVRPSGGGLLVAGASEAGKSTAALLLCRRGLRLVSDDVVWVAPARGFRGLGWAIGLDRLPVTPATLEAEGCVLGRQGWRAEGGERLERFRIRPRAASSPTRRRGNRSPGSRSSRGDRPRSSRSRRASSWSASGRSGSRGWTARSPGPPPRSPARSATCPRWCCARSPPRRPRRRSRAGPRGFRSRQGATPDPAVAHSLTRPTGPASPRSAATPGSRRCWFPCRRSPWAGCRTR